MLIGAVYAALFCAECASGGEQRLDGDGCALPELMASAQALQARAQASGFAWTTIQALLDEASEAITQGQQALACRHLTEAKIHAELALEQAEYARIHWRLLVPHIDEPWEEQKR